MFGLMSVKKHEEIVARRNADIERLAGERNAALAKLADKVRELSALRPDAEKHRASVARLAAANAKRKADALAKKAGA